MKRLRMFYEDHKFACDMAAAGLGVVAAILLAQKVRNGRQPVSDRPLGVDLWQLDGGGASMIVVETASGGIHQFVREVGDKTPVALVS